MTVRLVNNGQLTNDNVDALITLNYDDANGEGIAFDATINASSDVISVESTNPLGSERTIYAAIGTTVEDDQNNAILASSSTFITTDSEPPVVAFSPSDGSTEISVDSEIVLTFSEPVRLIDGILYVRGSQGFSKEVPMEGSSTMQIADFKYRNGVLTLRIATSKTLRHF